jgi:hypothetical protein
MRCAEFWAPTRPATAVRPLPEGARQWAGAVGLHAVDLRALSNTVPTSQASGTGEIPRSAAANCRGITTVTTGGDSRPTPALTAPAPARRRRWKTAPEALVRARRALQSR